MTSDKPSRSDAEAETAIDTTEPTGETPVVVTTAPNVARAEMIAAVLRAEGIPAGVYDANISSWMPHWQFAIHSQGVPVVVPAELLDEANEILGRKASEPSERDVPENRTDELARRAFQAAVFSLFVPPLMLWALWRIVLAWRAAGREPPSRPNAFRAYLTFAFVLASIFLNLWGLLLFWG